MLPTHLKMSKALGAGCQESRIKFKSRFDNATEHFYILPHHLAIIVCLFSVSSALGAPLLKPSEAWSFGIDE